MSKEKVFLIYVLSVLATTFYVGNMLAYTWQGYGEPNACHFERVTMHSELVIADDRQSSIVYEVQALVVLDGYNASNERVSYDARRRVTYYYTKSARAAHVEAALTYVPVACYKWTTPWYSRLLFSSPEDDAGPIVTTLPPYLASPSGPVAFLGLFFVAFTLFVLLALMQGTLMQ
jgi:hypothetical protein